MSENIIRFNTVESFKEHFRIAEEFLTNGLRRIAWGDERDDIVQEPHRSILYIDGITSVGKTTLLSNLHSQLPDNIFLPEFISRIPDRYHNITVNTPITDTLRAEFWFYNQFVLKNKIIEQSNKNVVSDRGLLGLFAYSNIFEAQQEVSLRIMRRANQVNWASGLYIFLTAHPEVIRKRLISRSDIAHMQPEDWDMGMKQFIINLSENLHEIALKAQIPVIDTSEMLPTDVAETVMGLYNEYLS